MAIEEFIKQIDTSYSYHLAKKMETFRCNEKLGYRTAGSLAEFQTGELLYEEMKHIGLTEVTKDKITVDSWEFEKAQMTYTSCDKIKYRFELGSYQTDFHTKGKQTFPLVYVKKGTESDYKGIDVTGKLVLVDINQRDEWWINYPVYQSYLKGAAALIAVQASGYGEFNDTALNAQDIAGPTYAPAFSMSKADADILKQDLKIKKEIMVTFDAQSSVKEAQDSYNIVGKLKGITEDSMILVSAHYDSYFSGFQDDNAAIAMMLGIARAMILSEYQPNKTILFCAMAAEEWGMTNTKYDWSTGAYQEVFYVHPEWRGKVCVNFNFELPALAHGKIDKICSVYEYKDFLKSRIKDKEVPENSTLEGLEVIAPVKTWSDDFSIAISGIPSMVNDFSEGKFMETHYHSQYDNEKFYQESVYHFHHMLYGYLMMEYDQTILPPLNFTPIFTKLTITPRKMKFTGTTAEIRSLNRSIIHAKKLSSDIYRYITKINHEYKIELEKDPSIVQEYIKEYQAASEQLLACFKHEQDAFVRLNWHDDVKLPHEIIMANLAHVQEAIVKLKLHDCKGAMTAIYHIDNNRYAFLFERQVFEYFTKYVLEQEPARLQWGAGRIIAHEDLFDLTRQLRVKSLKPRASYKREMEQLQKVKHHQIQLLKAVMKEEESHVRIMTLELKKIKNELDKSYHD